MENIHDFILPLHISNENIFIECLFGKVGYYIKRFKELQNYPNLSNYKTQIENAIVSIQQQTSEIKDIFNLLLIGRTADAKEKMDYLLASSLSVLITPINKSNAFCNNFFSKNDYELDKLYLFRGRIVEPYKSLPAEDMYHIPLNNRGMVGSYRFSIPGVPCLYMASNSYVVWQEMSKPHIDELAISALRIDDDLLYNNIIDLTLPIYAFFDALTDEKSQVRTDKSIIEKIINSFVAIPIIVACSVVCDDNSHKRNFIVEYAFPQLIIQYFADNLVGVAYNSNKINSNGLPASNLAIPITKFEEGKRLGNVVSSIPISDSMNLGYFADILDKNSSLNVINKNANGPSSTRMHHSFSLALRNAESTFNKVTLGQFSNYSYDGFIKYNDSVFYKFDEYLLFMNDFKYLS